jgi:hypothetical protein
MFTNVHKSVYDTEDSMVRPEIAVVLALRNVLFPMLSSKLNLGNHERLRIVHTTTHTTTGALIAPKVNDR